MPVLRIFNWKELLRKWMNEWQKKKWKNECALKIAKKIKKLFFFQRERTFSEEKKMKIYKRKNKFQWEKMNIFSMRKKKNFSEEKKKW